MGKPGLDGHSNGAEQIAVRARDAGMDVVYEGIRLTPSQIAELGRPGGRARDRPLDPVGLARRAHPVRPRARCAEAGVENVPVVVGGIIPETDAAALRQAGVAAVYTPKDWDLNAMMRDIIVALAGSGADGSGEADAGRRRPEGVDTAAPA